MRLSDLVHAEVVDAAGEVVGRVQDVRLVQDGPLLGLVDNAFRVDGLLVGRSAFSVRLGFHRRNVTGPWPLTAVFHRLEKRIRFVPWSKVESVATEEGRVVLSCAAGELGPMPSVEAEQAR